MYDRIIDAFTDKIEVNECFNTFSFEFSKNSVIENKSNLIFLLGLAGSGKTFLINYLMHTKKDKEYIFFPRAFSNKEEFLSKLNINDIEKDKESFRNKPHLIIIDEAQLLDNYMLEFVRTLSDTKCFNFLLSMHLSDGEKIISQDHFKSREISVVKLNPITKNEMIRFINKKLFENKEQYFFEDADFSFIYKITNGNFRYIKRVIKRSFELLQFAVENKISKYNKINKCILTMAAIDLGLIDG
jgi:4-hydroxy-tetrahydrodipicolinate synthase